LPFGRARFETIEPAVCRFGIASLRTAASRRWGQVRRQVLLDGPRPHPWALHGHGPPDPSPPHRSGPAPAN